MKTCVIIPTYNESENIGGIIERIFLVVPDVAVLVVDDNSPDGTALLVSQLQGAHPNLRLLSRPGKQGLGMAYRDAFRHVLTDPELERVIMMDGDGSHSPAYLQEIISRSSPHAVVIGSRYVLGGRVENWELWRRILSRGGNLYSRVVAGLPMNDCTSGFMCVPTEYLRKISVDALDASGYAFLIELKYVLFRAGAVFIEVPIMFANRNHGSSKISNHIIREGIIAPWKLRLKDTSKSF